MPSDVAAPPAGWRAGLQRQRPRAPLRAAGALSLAALGLLVGPGARAHDTWLEERGLRNGRMEMALTTGNLFPRGESGTPASAVVDLGCLSTAGAVLPVRLLNEGAEALTLAATAPAGSALRECWLQTTTFEVELKPEIVPVYLREISAPAAVAEAWAEHQKQGLPWVERYTKHNRISFRAPAGNARPPAPMALDIEIDNAGTLRAGQVVNYRVLRDAQPLAGLAVELRGDVSRVGLWRRTDADGRASVPVPFAGRWVLRATDLRAVPGKPGHWESRFITHTFGVGEAAGAAAPAAQASR